MAGVATAGQPTPLVSGKPFCDSGVGEEELRAPFTPKSWMDFFFFNSICITNIPLFPGATGGPSVVGKG